MRSLNFKKIISFAAAFTLAGCAVGPNYKRPEVNTPTDFRGATNASSTNSFADLPWWSVFKDPVLQDLVQVALTNNYDLRITLTRVDQARAIQAQARSQFMPQVGYGGEANRGKNEYLGLPVPNGGQTMNSFLAGFGAVWEIDLWGRVRRMNEAARANFMATQEGRRAVMISLVSGVAAAYFELFELDDQLAIAQRTRDSYERTLKLFSDQHAGGLLPLFYAGGALWHPLTAVHIFGLLFAPVLTLGMLPTLYYVFCAKLKLIK